MVIDPETFAVDEAATADVRGGELDMVQVAIDEDALTVGLTEASGDKAKAIQTQEETT